MAHDVMETTPIIVKDVIYDLHTRVFHCAEKPLYPIKSHEREIIFSTTSIDVSGVYEVKRPTYLTNYLHHCIGHAYFDTTIPLLSILHEYDPEVLSRRGFQLFVLKDIMETQDSDLIRAFAEWDKNTIDYSSGSYKGAYAHFHRCFSDTPILFEKTFSTHRYIAFSTLIFGGNEGAQRSVHNCDAKYPGRRMVPATTDQEISRWIGTGKKAFAEYIGQGETEPSTVLFIARRNSREFTLESFARLKYILQTDAIFLEDYSFKEQIQLFSEAKIIISPHGSGLFHLFWCSPGTRVIEIFATNDSRKRIFQSFAKFFGLEYLRMECSTEEITTDGPIHIPDEAFEWLRDAVSRP